MADEGLMVAISGKLRAVRVEGAGVACDFAPLAITKFNPVRYEFMAHFEINPSVRFGVNLPDLRQTMIDRFTRALDEHMRATEARATEIAIEQENKAPDAE